MGWKGASTPRQDFDAALDARPAYAPALTNLGNLLLEARRRSLRQSRGTSRDRQPIREYALAYLNLGVAYKRVGRIAEGVRALREAQRLERASRGEFLAAGSTAVISSKVFEKLGQRDFFQRGLFARSADHPHRRREYSSAFQCHPRRR